MKQILLLALAVFSVVALFAQQRYGKLDSTFGQEGKVLNKNFGACYSLAIQKDNKIIAAGSGIGNLDTGFVIVRYLTGGSLDESFGESGRIVSQFNNYYNAAAFDVAVQGDSKILAAGTATSSANTLDIILARYQTNGLFDSSFGSNGTATLHIYNSNSVYSVLIQPDGRILVAGRVIRTTSETGQNFYILLARFNNDGAPDFTFGQGGTALTESLSIVTDIALQADGKIIACGSSGSGDPKFYTARYNGDGSIDKSLVKKELQHIVLIRTIKLHEELLYNLITKYF